jgi:hypothetical protein
MTDGELTIYDGDDDKIGMMQFRDKKVLIVTSENQTDRVQILDTRETTPYELMVCVRTDVIRQLSHVEDALTLFIEAIGGGILLLLKERYG